VKFRFESNLDYQLAAIESVCDLFRGQEICRTEFTVTREFGGGQRALALEKDLGIGNKLTLLDDEILANLSDIQLRNGLRGTRTRTVRVGTPRRMAQVRRRNPLIVK
jgi:type III restriction enzyme